MNAFTLAPATIQATTTLQMENRKQIDRFSFLTGKKRPYFHFDEEVDDDEEQKKKSKENNSSLDVNGNASET